MLKLYLLLSDYCDFVIRKIARYTQCCQLEDGQNSEESSPLVDNLQYIRTYALNPILQTDTTRSMNEALLPITNK